MHLLQVQRTLQLAVDHEQVLSRCSACNSRLSDRVLTSADVGPRVPEKARATFNEFWECGNPSVCAVGE